uniref:Uncharacterized protein n=1 Tax=Ananas comosus var. bracteatus TaxID=296719 RepID=A0A6V7NSH4_ANACO|nr:unnamed protein product [Ananas comosus var. bracteatus]
MASKSSQSTDSSSDAGWKAPSRPVVGGPAGRFIVNSRCFVGAYRKAYASIVKSHHLPVIQSTIFGHTLHGPGGGSSSWITPVGQVLDLNLKVASDIQNRYLEGKKVDRKNLEVVLKEDVTQGGRKGH